MAAPLVDEPVSDLARTTRRAMARGAWTPRVAVLGAGAAGLCTAIQLRAAGLTHLTVFEKSDGVGGTWRDNTYPGSGCDVPSHLYSFSFASKRDWTRKFAGQEEILGYFESLVDHYDLGPHLRLGTEVVAATWDDARTCWVLRLDDGTEHEADVLVSGLGQLNRPYVPDLEGLADFDGPVFHSARWRHDVELSGKDVAVVGIGASAIQFVPPVAAQAARTTLFQRTANYVAPRNDREYRPWEQLALRYLPGAQRAYRSWIYWKLEARWLLMRRGSRVGTVLRRRFGAELGKVVSDEKPAAALIPDYAPGCRRVLISDDWYPTVLRPDVDIVTSGVDRVTPHGLVDADGVEHRADVLVFGTGFRTTEFLAPLRIEGRDGVELSEAWADGASAYLGLSYPGFPNLFMLYGPNTNLGHNSILFMIEQQVGHVVQLLQRMVVERLAALEVTPEAQERFEGFVDSAVARTVWAEDCSSWYKTDSGRVTNNWPGPTVAYRRRLRRPVRGDWAVRPRGV
ncbi:MAG: flavin-containing monooxygenase [Actinomycetes bacterium]